MSPTTTSRLRLSLLVALACFGLGCPNPNTYTTPRTVGSGRVQHSIAAEAWGFSIPTTSSNGTSSTLRGTIPTFPTYTLRIGVGDFVEIGARIANFSSLGGDLKLNFIRSTVLDVAIDPGAQIYSVSESSSSGSTSGSVGFLHVPLLIGLNFSRTFSLVLAPGVTYGFASATVSSASGRDQASAISGAIGRLGLGFDIRMAPNFALHPEITFLRTFENEAVTSYILGLGFNVGAMPNYDDLGGGPPPPPPPPPGYAPPPGYGPPPGYPPPQGYPPPGP